MILDTPSLPANINKMFQIKMYNSLNLMEI